MKERFSIVGETGQRFVPWRRFFCRLTVLIVRDWVRGNGEPEKLDMSFEVGAGNGTGSTIV